MKIIAIELENFRKFRKPLAFTGFADGLNIVVEPNETGKSTLLEALRAAFFIRHSAKNELVRSFCPFGDDVAPKIAVTFEVGGKEWRLEKQFLKSPHVRLAGGGGGQIESDAAEDRLQTLLGFEKGNNRNSDPETRGALGLLWVEQASAFSAEAPGRVARDDIRGALEAEVGTILGGRRFDLVRARIDEAYGQLRTARSGKSTGRLAEAEAALSAARQRRIAAETTLKEYEEALAALEAAQTAKRLIERDLADPEQAERRQKLNEDLKLAESAQLRLSAATARHAESEAAVTVARQLLARINDAHHRRSEAERRMVDAQSALAKQQADYEVATADESQKRAALGDARAIRAAADEALQQARAQSALNAQRAAFERARARLIEVRALEATMAEKLSAVGQLIPEDQLGKLAELDRAATEARAVHAAGAVTLDIELLGDVAVLVDGRPAPTGRIEIARQTDLVIPDTARVTITPPMTGARSAEAALQSANDALTKALQVAGTDSYAAAITRNENARATRREVDALRRQIDAICLADPSLELKPGAEALKALLASDSGEDAAPSTALDLAELETAFTSAREREEVASAILGEAQQALRSAETLRARLDADFAAATRDLATAVQVIEALPDGAVAETVAARLAAENEELGRRAEILAQAESAASNLDGDRIRRSIENIDIAGRQANEERVQLIARIAALEATIAREGPKGPPSILAEAVEAEETMTAQCERLQHEAEVLELLRNTLRLAGEDASRTFLGPVTQRAARYVSRILPNSDLSFDEDLGLKALRRNGIDEASDDLSRGTQEQLAVLTRLAFADLLLEKGAPVSLILDDPLVYSDDSRLEVMTDILLDASKRMQIILLTCRAKAFRHVAGNRITLLGV